MFDRGSEYASDFEHASVLNIPGFWIYQGWEYARVLNMPLVLNMSGFWIYHGSMLGLHRVPNIPENARIIPGYARKVKICFFSIAAGSIWFCLFRLNIFASKISNLLLPLGPRGPGAVRKSWYIQPMIYPINIYMNSLMIYLSVLLLLFLHFLVLQRTLSDIHKGFNSVIF